MTRTCAWRFHFLFNSSPRSPPPAHSRLHLSPPFLPVPVHVTLCACVPASWSPCFRSWVSSAPVAFLCVTVFLSLPFLSRVLSCDGPLRSGDSHHQLVQCSDGCARRVHAFRVYTQPRCCSSLWELCGDAGALSLVLEVPSRGVAAQMPTDHSTPSRDMSYEMCTAQTRINYVESVKRSCLFPMLCGFSSQFQRTCMPNPLRLRPCNCCVW